MSRLAQALAIAVVIARPLSAQFHFTHRDTPPQKVVQRALDGFNHHDVVASEAEYQPTYVYQYLPDSAGPRLACRVDMRDALRVVLHRPRAAHPAWSRRGAAGP